jgi:hypothetical protein
MESKVKIQFVGPPGSGRTKLMALVQGLLEEEHVEVSRTAEHQLTVTFDPGESLPVEV